MNPLSDINARNAFIEAFLPRLEDSQVIESCSNVCKSLRKRIFNCVKPVQIQLTKLFVEKIIDYLTISDPKLAGKCRALHFTEEETVNVLNLQQLKELLKAKVQGLAWILKKLTKEELFHFQQSCKTPLALTHLKKLDHLVELHHRWNAIQDEYAKDYHHRHYFCNDTRVSYSNRLLKVSDELYQLGYFRSCLLLAYHKPDVFFEVIPYAFRKVAKAMPAQAFISLVQTLQLDNSAASLYEMVKVLRFSDPYQALEFALKMSDDEFPAYQIRAFDHIIHQFVQLADLQPIINIVDQLDKHVRIFVCYFLMVALLDKFEDMSKAEEIIEHVEDPHDKSFLYAHLSLSSIYTMADIDQSLTLLKNVHPDYEVFRSEVQVEIVRFLTKEEDWKRALTLTEAIEELEFKDMALALISTRLHKIDFQKALTIAKQIINREEKYRTLVFLLKSIYKKDPVFGLYILFLIPNDRYWPNQENRRDFSSRLVEILPPSFLEELIKCNVNDDNVEEILMASSLSNQILPLIALNESDNTANQKLNKVLGFVKRFPLLEQATLLSDMCEVALSQEFLSDQGVEQAVMIALNNCQPMRNQSLFRIALAMVCHGKCPLKIIDLIEEDLAITNQRFSLLIDLINYSKNSHDEFNSLELRWKLALQIDDPIYFEKALNKLMPTLLKYKQPYKLLPSWIENISDGTLQSIAQEAYNKWLTRLE